MASILKVAAGAAVVVVVTVVASIGHRVAAPPATHPTPPYMQSLLAKIAADEAKAGPNAPKAVADSAGILLRSVGFEFPTEGRAFPPGPGQEVVAGNCMSCHTPGMILNQPALTRAEWAGEVTKMVKVYHAPVDEADIPAIVTYLASIKVAP